MVYFTLLDTLEPSINRHLCFMDFQNNPLASVVVTTKNEEKNIGRCLEAIKEQTYPVEKIEIIVVDSNLRYLIQFYP